MRYANVLVLCVSLWSRVAFGADAAGQVAALEGTAEVTRGGTTQPIKAGDPIYVGDKLKTAPASKLRLLLKDETVLTLAASTEMVVNQEDVGGATSKTGLGMMGGTLRALVTERYGTPGSKFEVETPTAIAGVRGTGFVISYDAATGTTTVVGLFDTTWVRSKNGRGEVTVGPDRTTEVRRGGLPRKPGRVEGPRLRRLIDVTDARQVLDGGGPAEPPAGDGPDGRLMPPRGVKRGGRDGLGGPRGVLDQPGGVIFPNGESAPNPPVRTHPKPPPPPPGHPSTPAGKP